MRYFKQGETITHTDLNGMVNAINALDVATSGFSSYSFGCRDAVWPGTEFYGIHQRRWLIYRSTGEVHSMDYVPGPDEDTPLSGHRVELPDCNEEFCMFDLHTVGWLKYGDWYTVEGSEFALETDTDA